MRRHVAHYVYPTPIRSPFVRLSARCASILSVSLLAVAPWSRGLAQSNIVPRDTAVINRSTNPLLAPFRFRSIGPASMGGRIDDLAVYETDPRIIYVGYATGGVFKPTNAGTSFAPIFEQYGTASIGDLAVDQSNPDIVWVGTGEPNNRQTSTFGDGIYKSTNGGKSFSHVGLRETQSIARIVIDPRSPNTVYVASPGHLFGPNSERGVYKTTDGGQTWNKIKYIDENTGFTDLVMDPSNSNVLYAASYQRRRTGCCFNGGGPGSALWKTEDGGATWTKLASGGLPPGQYGRIAVDVARSNADVVYAQIETNGADSAATFASATGGRGGYDWCSNAGPNKGFSGAAADSSADSTRTPPPLSMYRSGLYRSDNKGRTWTLVSNCNGRPMYFSNIRVDPTSDQRVYLSNTRAAKSLDGGRTFAPMDEGLGYGNETVDQHAYWIDPANADHIIRGSDAGLAISWDQGVTWEYVKTMATGLAYWVSADMERPYNVFAGLQDNDTWSGPSALRSRNGIRNHNWFRYGGGDGFQTAVDPTNSAVLFSEAQDGNTQRRDLRTGEAKSIRPVAPPAPRDAPTPAPGTCVDGRITPPADTSAAARGGGGGGGGFGGRGGGTANVVNGVAGERYRFNWNTPYMLSPHDPNIVWLGGNRLFRSTDQGDLWVASADLTKAVDRCDVTVMGVRISTPLISENDGVSSYSTITAVSESPVRAGIVWAGTDDGNLQVSRDHGVTFTEVGRNLSGLPKGALSGDNPYWISRIETSHAEAGTAYVAVDGHRSDDLTPYIFVTRDYGATWKSVSGNLPARGNVQVVREDPRNPQLLYAGTEFGLFVSLNGGTTWERFMNGYPTVRTDDILIHPRDGDLIVASHGRSLWIADDITPLQQWSPAVAAADATLFDVRPAVAYKNDVRLDIYTGGEQEFEGENPARGTAIQFYTKKAGEVTVRIANAAGRAVCESTLEASAGLNRLQWALVTPMLAAAPAATPAATRDSSVARRPARADTSAAVARPATPARNTDCAPAATGGRGGGGSTAEPGSYIVTLIMNGTEHSKTVQVLEDRWMFVR